MNHTKSFFMHRRMLRIASILMMLFMLVPLASGLANAAEPTLSQSSFIVSADAGTVTVTVKNATGSISVSTDSPGWLRGIVDGNRITVRFQKNDYVTPRNGKLTVQVGKKTLYISVRQVRKLLVKDKDSGAKITSGSFDGYPATKNIYLDATGAGTITATKNKDWINVSVSYGTVRISVKPNFSAGSRSGIVTIADGYNKMQFTVNQSKYSPSLHGGSFMFSVKPVSNDFKAAYQNMKSKKTPKDVTEADTRALIDQTLAYLGCKNTAKFPSWDFQYAGVLIDKYQQLGVANLYGGYDDKYNVVIVNLSNANTGELIAKTIIHELRHYWQYYEYGRYNGSYSEYVIKYGCVNYTSPSDTTQILEVDAHTFADKVVELLNK